MKFLYTICILTILCPLTCFPQQQHARPKIGVTLSGGGAKGLAHIGILKAIDSAGLNIDYITGTSMGSVIGGLYSVGYAADSIETLAKAIDWELLLSNQSSLRSVFMPEKDEYGKYVVELPWVNHRFTLPSGILEGQELWLKFSELFFPVSNIKDFSKFSIPFKCIATDVGTGEAVVMEGGEIISSIRSSMAIPSFFTAVNMQDKRLIDGGIVRNFPVQDVKRMGADIVIGSNVASGLLASNKVRSAIQVLLQVAFFREAEDHRNEVPLCDIYVVHSLDKYNMGSFGQAEDILQAGIEEGRRLYPRLKKLADSLNAIYGPELPVKNRLPSLDKIKISSFELSGLKNTTIEFFINTLDLRLNGEYTAKDISEMIRHAFGTRYYNRILYSLHEQQDGSYKIVFDIVENPLTFSKIGLHYDKFSGISAIVNITTRNFLVTNSRSLLTLNIGDNFRVRAQHLQYIGRHKNFSASLGVQYDRFNINAYNSYSTYNSYRETGLYKRQYTKFDLNTAFSPSRQFSTGLGFKMELLHYSPIISAPLEFKGSNNFPTAYAFIKFNSLDKQVLPRRGLKIDAEAGWVMKQSANVKVLQDGDILPPEAYPIATHPYSRALLNIESYYRITSRTTAMTTMQSGVNMNYTGNIMNEFSIGGLIPLYNNQVLFAGLPEATTYAPTVAGFMGGLRYEFLANTYVTGKANILFTNFINKSIFFDNINFLSGYALTFSYNFALGPLEISAMYADQSKRIRTYVSFGIPF
ncbi:MAG: patatin-like phospholipase family protein [Chitinophagaceae bacterium]|nr:patatin-like phospholipase family protein [Chitinophagaceae bacterium]